MKKMMNYQFSICSIHLKNGHLTLKDNSNVVVKKYFKYSYGQIELDVLKYNTSSVISNTPIESNITGSFYVSTTDMFDLLLLN